MYKYQVINVCENSDRVWKVIIVIVVGVDFDRD